jgi:hypothetical protein
MGSALPVALPKIEVFIAKIKNLQHRPGLSNKNNISMPMHSTTETKIFATPAYCCCDRFPAARGNFHSSAPR